MLRLKFACQLFLVRLFSAINQLQRFLLDGIDHCINCLIATTLPISFREGNAWTLVRKRFTQLDIDLFLVS